MEIHTKIKPYTSAIMLQAILNHVVFLKTSCLCTSRGQIQKLIFSTFESTCYCIVVNIPDKLLPEVATLTNHFNQRQLINHLGIQFIKIWIWRARNLLPRFIIQNFIWFFVILRQSYYLENIVE